MNSAYMDENECINFRNLYFLFLIDLNYHESNVKIYVILEKFG